MTKAKSIYFTPKLEGNFAPKRIHFMGIGGSGISGIAILAKKNGYEVDGCDLEKTTNYLTSVKNEKIKILVGHDKKHAESVDLVVASPAILYVNWEHLEVIEARKRGKLVTWEEFLGKYLHKKHEVLCVAGTHGKSTTTAMLAKAMVEAGYDPSVTIGATLKEWGVNFRKGDGKYFITEADEFNDNFLAYKPSAIILNNVEMDHADFFKDREHVFTSFSKFLQKLNAQKIVIYNDDSLGVKRVLEMLPESLTKDFKMFGYTLRKSKPREDNIAQVALLQKNTDSSEFSVVLDSIKLNCRYSLGIPGEFNVANAAGVAILAKLYKIPDDVVKKAFHDFHGVGRRLELIGEKNGIKVYDDYAHHPTAIKATLGALRQKYPKNRIWAVNEPHSYSRTKALLNEYSGVFDEADKVIITPIFKARDKETFGITEEKLASAASHKDIRTFNSFEEIVNYLKENVSPTDVILVMGAGKSYILAYSILNNI